MRSPSEAAASLGEGSAFLLFLVHGAAAQIHALADFRNDAALEGRRRMFATAANLIQRV